MAQLNAERERGKSVLASTHDLAGVAEHFTRLLSLNVALIADGPASLVRDPEVLRATYGGHLINVEAGSVVLLDDAHHQRATR
jgi:ABC-type Mn2+/Zn2+ transport system ATPase subunit